MNKNGWGLRVELAFILLFLVCLIVAVIGITIFSENTNMTDVETLNNDSLIYSDLENKLQDAAIDYNNKNTTNLDVITLDMLLANGYIESLSDEEGKSCNGYVKLIKNSNNNINYVSYIKCKNYKTFGYESSLD